MTSLLVFVTICVAFLPLDECGDKTPSCSKCDWELKVATRDTWESGTDKQVSIYLHFDTSYTYTKKIDLKTSGNDFSVGDTETYTFDASDSTDKVVFYYMVVAEGSLIPDKWQPKWTQLRNKNRPEQVKGKCEYKAGIWVGDRTAICCIHILAAKGCKCRTPLPKEDELKYYLEYLDSLDKWICRD